MGLRLRSCNYQLSGVTRLMREWQWWQCFPSTQSSSLTGTIPTSQWVVLTDWGLTFLSLWCSPAHQAISLSYYHIPSLLSIHLPRLGVCHPSPEDLRNVWSKFCPCETPGVDRIWRLILSISLSHLVLSSEGNGLVLISLEPHCQLSYNYRTLNIELKEFVGNKIIPTETFCS